jgi:hypothetical protein
MINNRLLFNFALSIHAPRSLSLQIDHSKPFPQIQCLLRPSRLLYFPPLAGQVPAISHRIFSVKNFDEFYQLYEQNKQEITGELLGSVSKHLITLITTRDQRLSYDKASSLITNL